MDQIKFHKNGQEYVGFLINNILQGVKKLTFYGFIKEAGCIQIGFLIEDLNMDTTHNMIMLLNLLKWFYKYQVFYPNTSTTSVQQNIPHNFTFASAFADMGLY